MEETKKITIQKEIKDAMKTVGFVDRIISISNKYSLNIDKTSALALETIFIFAQIEDGESVIPNLMVELEVSEEIAKNIATDIRDQIFIPIKNELGKNGGNITESKSTQAPQEDSREKILSEIENPETIGQKTASVPENLPTGKPPEMYTTQYRPQGRERDEIASRLTGTTRPPNINIPEKPSTDVSQNKQALNVPKYSEDPYRETIK